MDTRARIRRGAIVTYFGLLAVGLSSSGCEDNSYTPTAVPVPVAEPSPVTVVPPAVVPPEGTTNTNNNEININITIQPGSGGTSTGSKG